MTDITRPRYFADDAAVRDVGQRFVTHRLPRAEWTHEAHLATCLWLLVERPDIDVDNAIAGLIAGYNVSIGGVNDDTQGYHHSITLAFVAGARLALGGVGASLVGMVNALLDSPMGRRDWPLRFWSAERLFSVEARRGWVKPDISPLPAVAPIV